ncbi:MULTISPECIES: ATP synthase F1 subunit gamma [Bacillales]|uniref:ATP synthase gamma chain n=1 Tax=Brevibacillus brevis (strain 47 / JCM 6285 / NBRC 100599) TaxID=358681 RepID=ATPG_BREBN|nr:MULTISPECIES: ATP synthase F1 subunit gamma [Bacillales]C0Z777.1 RecName: Full=ATP synthase gamma chain; AltName: Full=ATP synthase F1 sector gamma subunit; AltName: Full=F-ATPase gamma subunit [Brevibacillus brevis NBRC 100599]KMZ43914.1 ATP F0F1 synthase subunit gamma [Bacillus sp. FJAT-27238]MBH0330748.1 ATP F0F1 synthase subunit gamma [Brevibacillus brevis]NRR03518.1 F0F1 ATP synthase subunit gamma [Brevibacillus sp. RS1.1]NRS47656.1 F0F1 ATP synthase subunit gamma [Brevibacillus sp. HB
MAKGIREIRRSIKSKKDMRQITKAMKMVAAAKLRRNQDKAEAARPYADKIQEVIASIASGTSGSKHPMLQNRPVKKTGYIVITSDRGLAGGYNANILRKVVNTINEKHKSKDEYGIFVIGRKGRDFFSKRNYPLLDEVTGLPTSPAFADIKKIAGAAVQMFENEQIDELYLCYNKFQSAISQIPTVKQLLPLEAPESNNARAINYEYEPSSEEVLADLLPKYAETLVYSALLEAKASEEGSRMTAMGNATDNATDMINRLTLSYNRARQAAITQEISEIVAGANAQA